MSMPSSSSSSPSHASDSSPSHSKEPQSPKNDYFFKSTFNSDKLMTAIAGGTAGIVTSFIFCPLDVVKTRLQVQARPPPGQPPKYRGLFPTLRVMFIEEGFRSYYKGLSVTVMGLVPNWAIYFTTYETCKSICIDTLKMDASAHANAINTLSAVGSGAITSALTAPFWTVRTRLQTQVLIAGHEPLYKSTFHTFARIIRDEGFGALYKGLAPSLLGLVHVGVQLPVYEYLKKEFRSLHPDHDLSPAELIASSAIAKCIASVSAYPHEVLRSRLQDTNPKYNGLVNACQTIFREEGVTAFYRGMGTNLLRVVPAAAVTFASYELALRYLKHSKVSN